MSTTFAITTLVELVIAGLLVYGYMHERTVIEFEQNLVSYARKVKKKICRRIYSAIVNYEIKKLKKARPAALTPSTQVR